MAAKQTYEEQRRQWLAERRSGIGGSEASAVIGANPYLTNVELWEIKTGRRIPEDIGDKPYVKYGKEAEKPLREIFKLDYPIYKVTYHEFKLVRNPDYPFIFATLDGELEDKISGERGVLEIKTTEILSSMAKENWRDRVPDNYFIQVLHQILATGWSFAWLKAQLKYVYGEQDIRHITNHYRFLRSEYREDLDYLLEQEIQFWREYVEADRRPPLLLPEI